MCCSLIFHFIFSQQWKKARLKCVYSLSPLHRTHPLSVLMRCLCFVPSNVRTASVQRLLCDAMHCGMVKWLVFELDLFFNQCRQLCLALFYFVCVFGAWCSSCAKAALHTCGSQRCILFEISERIDKVIAFFGCINRYLSSTGAVAKRGRSEWEKWNSVSCSVTV